LLVPLPHLVKRLLALLLRLADLGVRLLFGWLAVLFDDV